MSGLSKGVDHVCTKNENHGVYSPQGSQVGSQCPIHVHGVRCNGVLKAVGEGARKANAVLVSA